MTTGLSTRTFENLQLNAGIFMVNFDHEAIEDAVALREAIASEIESGVNVLGATRGGGSFQCTPTMRSVEADGKRSEFVGSMVNDGWTVKLTTTLLEITPENFARALICADVQTVGKRTVVTIRTDVEVEDYIPSLCWVGDTSEGLMLIELDHALNLTGANFTFTDKGEGTLPVEFQAHQGDLLAQEEAPCRVIFFGEPDAA